MGADNRPAVLVVDDRPENLVAMRAALEGLDCETITAASGNEALGLILERGFALVLLDVNMPDMDGFEAASLIRQNRKSRDIPIIFVTAFGAEREFVFKGYERGAFDYIFKPVDPFVLRSKVGVFLELFRQRSLLEESVAGKELLLKEIHHRIKNNLAVISSIIALQSEEFADGQARESFLQLTRRIDSMGLVHELLYKGGDLGTVDMGEYLESLVAGILGSMAGPSTISSRVEAGGLRAATELAFPLGLLVTEFVTNSIKHAFPEGRAGEVFVELSVAGDEALLAAGDDGCGMGTAGAAGARPGSGLGLRLGAALAQQLRGSLSRREGKGTVFELRFPARGLASVQAPR